MTRPEAMRAAKRTLRQAQPGIRREYGVSPQLDANETRGDFVKALLTLILLCFAFYCAAFVVAAMQVAR